jgi:hypothetical protein
VEKDPDSSLAAVSDEPTPVFCRKCHHDLGGIQASSRGYACPECGQTFDPGKPKTFAVRQRSAFELLLLRRVAPGVLLALAVFWLLWHAWIPRPVALFGRHGPAPAQIRMPELSSLWVWGDGLYGTEEVRLQRHIAEADLWDSRVRRVRVFDPNSGELNWEVLFEPREGEPGGGIWTVRLPEAVPLTFDLLSSFRLTRDGILGIVVGEHDPSESIEPFEVTGSEADVLSAYIRASGISVRPIRQTDDQVAFWIFDDDQQRLVQVDEAELDRRGIVPLDRTGIAIQGLGTPP